MVYVRFEGRLGNTMFQLAAGMGVAAENNDEVCAPSAEFYKFVNYKPQHASFVQYSTVYSEPHFHYSKIPYTKDMLITGYYQSEKYFENIKDKVKESYSIKDVYENQIREKYKELLEHETISMHIRRTDYLNLETYHPPLTLDYYKQALDHINPGNKKVVVFSDDIPWCKTVFVGDRFTFIEGNLDIVDMTLMSYCTHNIIANSSFSWWGAYLNKNPNKIVVAPDQWFGPSLKHHDVKDIYCEGWVKL